MTNGLLFWMMVMMMRGAGGKSGPKGEGANNSYMRCQELSETHLSPDQGGRLGEHFRRSGCPRVSQAGARSEGGQAHAT